MEFYVDLAKCSECGFCVESCPLRIIEMQKGQTPNWIEDADQICLNCGHCVAVCPEEAVSLSTMTPLQCSPVQDDLFPTFEQMSHFFRCRRSIRAFKCIQLERKILENLITATNYSATASNSQKLNWLIIVDKEVGILAEITAEYVKSLGSIKYKDRIIDAWDSGVDTICRNAPAVVIAHSSDRNWNCLLAMTQLSLLAPTLGMGTCWAGFIMVAAENSDSVRSFLDLPEGHTCHGAMVVGYPKYEYPRLPLRNEPVIRWH